jgi:hypothetical protein
VLNYHRTRAVLLSYQGQAWPFRQENESKNISSICLITEYSARSFWQLLMQGNQQCGHNGE